jgi:hypothetical protein
MNHTLVAFDLAKTSSGPTVPFIEGQGKASLPGFEACSWATPWTYARGCVMNSSPAWNTNASPVPQPPPGRRRGLRNGQS